jgi:hypothetical protein
MDHLHRLHSVYQVARQQVPRARTDYILRCNEIEAPSSIILMPLHHRPDTFNRGKYRCFHCNNFLHQLLCAPTFRL